MRKIILFLLVFTSSLLYLSYAQEWGNLEITTEVNSKYGQDYIISFEKWWDENLGIGSSLFYNSLENIFSYNAFLKTPYLKLILGEFYPNLNLFTENLELYGYQTSLYLGNNELFYISGNGERKFFNIPSSFHKKNFIPIKILGWNSPITKKSFINLSLTSLAENLTENYMINISFLNKNNLPLGDITTSQEMNLFLKDSNLYISLIINASLSLGSISLKGLFGYLNPNTPSFCTLEPGDLGGILNLTIPLSSKIFPEYILGYMYNLSTSDHKIILGLNAQYNLIDNLYLLTSTKYTYSTKNNSNIFTQIAINFPTLEGSIWNSLYLKYEKTLNEENTSLGLKISYQF